MTAIKRCYSCEKIVYEDSYFCNEQCRSKYYTNSRSPKSLRSIEEIQKILLDWGREARDKKNAPSFLKTDYEAATEIFFNQNSPSD